MVRTEKCNFWQQLGSIALGPVASVASGIIQNNNNKKMQREAMAHQTSEREASQQWQDQQRIASQGYQTSEREAQNAFSERMYNQYQSPDAMARQYEQAGLNPRLAVEGTAAPGASSGSSGGAPSASAPQGTTVAPPYQNISSWAQGFGDIAQAMKSLAEAKKAGVETKRYEKFIDEEFRGIQLSNDAQEVANAISKVDLNVKEQTALKQAFAVLNDTNASYEKKHAELSHLEQLKLLTKKQVDTFDEKFANEQANIKADTSNKEADTSLKDAQRRLQNLMAETEKEHPALYRSMVHLNNEMATLHSLENEIRETNSEDEKEALKEEYLERSAAARKKAYELSKDHDTQNGGIFGEISSGLRSARQIILGR